MGLRQAYTLWAPLYDLVVDRAFVAQRRRSLAELGEVAGQRILIDGVGTGLDYPHLPPGATYVGVDLTWAMLARAARRPEGHGVRLVQGDAMALPFADGSFDQIVMHLILAVVPEPARALREAARVLKPGGQILILDKFLKPGERAPLRRLASPLLGRLATRTDVVFEAVLAAVPDLVPEADEAALGGDWFRRIRLRKAV
ncbi:MAG: methyltransferase domain-containing protein [Pseudomonadota bacterium]